MVSYFFHFLFILIDVSAEIRKYLNTSHPHPRKWPQVRAVAQRTKGTGEKGAEAPRFSYSDMIAERLDKLAEIAIKGDSAEGKLTAEITNIEFGKFKDLANPKYFEIVTSRNPEKGSADAVRITYTDKGVGLEWKEVYIVPNSVIGFKRSKLFRLVKAIGKPEVGKKVEYEFDSRGFPHVKL